MTTDSNDGPSKQHDRASRRRERKKIAEHFRACKAPQFRDSQYRICEWAAKQIEDMKEGEDEPDLPEV